MAKKEKKNLSFPYLLPGLYSHLYYWFNKNSVCGLRRPHGAYPDWGKCPHMRAPKGLDLLITMSETFLTGATIPFWPVFRACFLCSPIWERRQLMLRSSPAVGFGCNRGFLWTHTHAIITRPTINITIVLSFFNRLCGTSKQFKRLDSLTAVGSYYFFLCCLLQGTELHVKAALGTKLEVPFSTLWGLLQQEKE